MSKEPFKRWKNERQHKCKLDVRMLEKDILGQLSDVSLVGNFMFRSTNIYKMIDDCDIVSVIGKVKYPLHLHPYV